MEQESNYFRGEQPFDIDLGELFEIEYLREDESIEVEFDRLKIIIETILYNQKKIAVPFEPTKDRADYIKSKWLILQDKTLRKGDGPFPCENYFLRENRDPELSNEELVKKDVDPLYNYDLYSYTSTIIITPESKWLSLEDYLFIVAFRIRQLNHAILTDFLNYQNEKYWDDKILEKLRYFAYDNPNLIQKEKRSIIENWTEDQSNSDTSISNNEIRMEPDLSTREVCMLLFVLLKGVDAWPRESNATKQSRVIELIHAVSGYSKDGIKSKVSKTRFLNEDSQYDVSLLKVRCLLEDLKSATINDIVKEQLL